MEEIIDMQMPVLLCAILLIVISIPLYFGKGSNMIAGYNDLSQVDKEKINKMRLCKMLAMTLDITAIILMLGAYSIISMKKKSKNRIIRINTGILSNMKQKIKEFYH